MLRSKELDESRRKGKEMKDEPAQGIEQAPEEIPAVLPPPPSNEFPQ